MFYKFLNMNEDDIIADDTIDGIGPLIRKKVILIMQRKMSIM